MVVAADDRAAVVAAAQVGATDQNASVHATEAHIRHCKLAAARPVMRRASSRTAPEGDRCMQIAYRARGIEDARTACSLLASVGIDAHIADQGLWEVAGNRPEADVIRVLVDNRKLDKARRALRDWVTGRENHRSSERSYT